MSPAIMDVRAVVSSVFDNNKYLYLHCLDLRVEKIINPQTLPCVELYMVLGHVSFPAKLRERRVVLILHSEENVDKMRGRNSPAVIEVTSCCIYTIEDGPDKGCEIMLIFQFDVLVNNSIAATSKENVRPIVLPSIEDNEVPSMPFLKLHSVTCNCSASHPKQVLLEARDEENGSKNDPPSPPHTELDEQNAHEDNQVDEIYPIVNTSDDDDDAGECEEDKTKAEVCYSETFQLKGSTFHQEFQRTLKDCKEILLNKSSSVELAFFKEPLNIKDENAIVVQAKVNGHFSSIGYVPGKKIAKIEAAIESDKIAGINLSRVQYTYIWGACEHKYVPYITVTKRGRWSADDKHYKYNT